MRGQTGLAGENKGVTLGRGHGAFLSDCFSVGESVPQHRSSHLTLLSDGLPATAGSGTDAGSGARGIQSLQPRHPLPRA